MNYSKNLKMLYRNNSPSKNHWFLNPNENSSLKDSELLECFESSDDHLPIPDLVSIQRSSFQNFIKRGFISAFEKNNPLKFSNSNNELQIIFFPEWIQFRKPEMNSKQTIRLGKTYGCSVYIPVLTKCNDWVENKIEWILLGFLPLMTKEGHFLINGIPRVVLHQMVRNPGIYTIPRDSRTRVPTIRIVPEQGSWLNITLDKKNRVWVTTRILRRKVSGIIFLQALGISISEIYRRIEHSEILQASFVKELKADEKTRHDSILIRAGLKGHPFTQEEAWRYLYAHFQEYTSQTREQIISDETAREFFWKVVWNRKNRNLGILGRQQFREKLGSALSSAEKYLTGDDMVLATQALLKLLFGERMADDIDSLTNKRVRGCGEFLHDELIRGLREFELLITRKFNNISQSDTENLWRFNRSTLSKCVSKSWKSFFTAGTLSQFMDETNPLAETTHKRRVTVLGPGGVNSKQTTIQIRGIHPTYYGRLCPIETPEGQNAGLVNSFTVYTQRDAYGNLETPFYPVYKGQIQKSLNPIYVAPQQESDSILAPADIGISKWNTLPKTRIPVRKDWKFDYAMWNQITNQSVGILQMISVATSLIPFLEHDDANRALMGSNMQRQAVPLLKPEVAIVRTGLEIRVISDVSHVVQAAESGFVTSVRSNLIKVHRPRLSALPVSKIQKIIKVLQTENQLLETGTATEFHLCASKLCFEDENKVLKNRTALSTFSDLKPNLESECHLAPTLLRSCFYDLQKTKSDYSIFGFHPPTQKSKKVDFGSIQSKFLPHIEKPQILPKFSSKEISIVLSDQNFTTKFSKNFALKNMVLVVPNKTSGSKSNTFLKSVPTPILEKTADTNLIKEKSVLKQLSNSFSKDNLSSIDSSPKQNCHLQNIVLKNQDEVELNKELISGLKKEFSASQTISFLNSQKNQKTFSEYEQNYSLDLYQRTNQSTCIYQRPVVKEREWVQKADILADGAASSRGKLALGKNVLVCYLPWEGYNFEDAILISERLVFQDIFTSLHIDYYEVEVKNTQYGLETITNQVPIEVDDPVRDVLRLQRLNTQGLIEVGTWVEEGDYLVGKVSPMSPKGPSVQQQYEKLYNVIMQRENTNLRNTSLRVPKSVEGFVLDVQILPPKEADVLALAPKNSLLRVRIALLQRRKIQVGDKMAGRHGNKGVISKILPIQDMPYLPDGTPIDIVLNPLGVPSRMNVGQILECLLGLAGKYLNESYTINLFDEQFGAEASRSLVYSKLYQASIKTQNPWLFEPHHPGKIKLFDGRTGESFDQPVTVGYAYMLKLVHLVDDKIHARATGPYSAVTQQPVRGRSRNGGQRLGEMEVWALQAYGAAYTLQELLTIKSDDVDGRKEAVFRIYTNQSLKFGQPESFRVLLRELQSLCFNLKIYGHDSKTGRVKSLSLTSLEKLGW